MMALITTLPVHQRSNWTPCVFSRHCVVRLDLRQGNCAVPAFTPSIHHAARRSAEFFRCPPPPESVAVRKGAPRTVPRPFRPSFHFKWRGWCSSLCSASSLVQGSSCSQCWLTLHSATHLCHTAGQLPPSPPSKKNCLCGPHCNTSNATLLKFPVLPLFSFSLFLCLQKPQS